MNRARGFTLIEVMVGMLVGSLVMAGAYSLWSTHQQEGYRIGKKIELRNKLALSSKRLQRSITLAGLGLSGSANLAKDDAVGSDTLIIYTNPTEAKSYLNSATDHHHSVVQVATPGHFTEGGFVAIVGGGHAELRRVTQVSGSTLYLDTAFTYDYAVAGTLVYPAQRERFYSDQEENRLLHETSLGTNLVAEDVGNFQVSFADKHGASTEIASQIRTVRFSLTGKYPAREGAMSTMVLSSTAIPRNTL